MFGRRRTLLHVHLHEKVSRDRRSPCDFPPASALHLRKPPPGDFKLLCLYRIFSTSPHSHAKKMVLLVRAPSQHGMLLTSNEIYLEHERGHTPRLKSSFDFFSQFFFHTYEGSQGSSPKQNHPRFIKYRVDISGWFFLRNRSQTLFSKQMMAFVLHT